MKTGSTTTSACDLAALAGASVFTYSLFISVANLARQAVNVPALHWQSALRFRTLTALELAARERYFASRSPRPAISRPCP